MTKDRLGFGRLVALGILLYGFFAQPRGVMGPSFIAVIAIIGVGCIAAIVAEFRGHISSPHGIYVDLIYYLATFIFVFAALYWSYGTRGNFNIALSHLDALYFTIGTFSTAGTGNIIATSELSRGLQTLQMLLDLGFVSVAITLVVTRLASLKK